METQGLESLHRHENELEEGVFDWLKHEPEELLEFKEWIEFQA